MAKNPLCWHFSNTLFLKVYKTNRACSAAIKPPQIWELYCLFPSQQSPERAGLSEMLLITMTEKCPCAPQTQPGNSSTRPARFHITHLQPGEWKRCLAVENMNVLSQEESSMRMWMGQEVGSSLCSTTQLLGELLLPSHFHAQGRAGSREQLPVHQPHSLLAAVSPFPGGWGHSQLS